MIKSHTGLHFLIATIWNRLFDFAWSLNVNRSKKLKLYLVAWHMLHSRWSLHQKLLSKNFIPHFPIEWVGICCYTLKKKGQGSKIAIRVVFKGSAYVFSVYTCEGTWGMQSAGKKHMRRWLLQLKLTSKSGAWPFSDRTLSDGFRGRINFKKMCFPLVRYSHFYHVVFFFFQPRCLSRWQITDF